MRDIEHCLYTLFWGLNMDYPSFVGSEMISEFTSCTLLDVSLPYPHAYFTAASWHTYIYIKSKVIYMAAPVSSLALLLCSLY